MKKTLWFSLLLIIVCSLSFTACNQKLPNNDNNLNDSFVCEHNFGDWITEKQANCKEEGLLTRVCTKCSHKEETTIAKTDIHTEVVDQALEATCTSTGLTEGKHCGVCGTTLVAQNIKSMLEHSYSSSVTAPTCTERGYTSYTCGCGESYISDYVDASGHSFGNWETVKEATTTEEGVQERTCACGEKETQTIDKLEFQGSVGLEYELNDDGKSYSVTGIGICTDTEVIIPSAHNGYPVTKIADNAFRYSSSITSFIIPNTVTSIGNNAFEYQNNLKTIRIPDSVISIGYRSFAFCSSLATISFGEESRLTSIGDSAFYSCKSLISIDIPNNVSLIEQEAFAHCESLINVCLPDNVNTISDSLFYSCDNLTSITISNKVTSIGGTIFNFCPLLTTINFKGTEAEWNDIAKAYNWDYNHNGGQYIIYCIDVDISK